MVGLAGKNLDRYVLGQRIGKGGMADVYLGYDPHFQRVVAIKIFKQDNDGMLQRFMREAKIMALLHHPHLVPIYDTGESEIDGMTRYYIVMPFIDGGTLGGRIRRSIPSPEEASRYLFDVATALDYIHQNGIIHRDIKSTNVLLRSDNLCYLSDLGVARLIDDYTMTSTGNVLGTVDYIAPELFVGNNKADACSDIYSLGVLLFEMVTGQRPFAAENQVALASMHVNEPPPLARTLVATLSPAVERVLLEALEKVPERRFPTATALADAFGQAVKMPHSFIPAPRPYFEKPDDEPGVPDQRIANQAAPAPVTVDIYVPTKQKTGYTDPGIIPVPFVLRHTQAWTRFLTPLLIALLFLIAVPVAWVFGQMHTTNTVTTIIRPMSPSGIIMPSAQVTHSHVRETAGAHTTAPDHKGTTQPSLPQVAVSSPTATPPENLIQDPSYEMQYSSQVAPPWVGVGDATIDFNSGQGRSGKSDARIAPMTPNSWSDIGETVTIKPDTMYTLSAYIRTSEMLTISATVFDVIAVHGPELAQIHYGPSPFGYSQISLTFNSSSYTSVDVRIGFTGLKNMWVQADDWSLHS